MDALQTVEKLILEFYDPYISNQRRREIDSTLQTYEYKPILWKECMRYVERNENYLVSSFCLKMIESTILRHWSKLPCEEKTMLHSSLTSYLLNIRNNIPMPIKKHAMKLIAKIVRNEWSAVGINFITDIIKVILSDDPAMVLLGLNFLLIASEELIDPRDTLCSTRKMEIRQNFESHIPHIFCLLSGTFHKYKNTDPEQQMIETLLLVYGQLLSWVPLTDFYTTDLLSPIYDCTTNMNYKTGVLAISSLNEILYKNCIPPENIPLITSICNKLNEILTHVCGMDVKSVDEEYLAKVLEAISLIFASHWHRIESNMTGADIITFISSFYKLTFHDINSQSYRMCLEIWCNFLEYLNMRDELHKKQYENLLVTLISEVIRKLYIEVSIHENMEQAKEQEEELDALFHQHMNVIDLIIELLPERGFLLIVDLWNRTKLVYVQTWTEEKIVDLINTEKEIVDALYAFRTCTQILTSLHSKIGEDMKMNISKNLKDVLVLGAHEYVKYRDNHNLLLRHMLNVHCAILKLFSVWIEKRNLYLEKEGTDLITAEIFNITLPFITNTANFCLHSELQIAAAFLISSIISNIKEINLLQPLFVDPTFKHLAPEAGKYVQYALCDWVCNCKSVSYEERLKFLRNLFELIAPNKVESLKNLCSILRQCKITRSDSKELLLKSLEPWLVHVIDLYPTNFHKNPELCEISLTFLVEASRVFQNQFKSEFLEKMLLTFDSCLNNVTLDNTTGYGFDKILALFTLLMEHPGHAYNEFISKILEVAQKIYIHVKRKRTDIQSYEDGMDTEFYKLLCCVIINKWQYFNGVPNWQSETEGNVNPILDAILCRISESFSEPDLSIFRNNLQCIEEMNNKWNLYEKEIFRLKHLPTIVNTLLGTLVENKHKLLIDEILAAIYHMAAVNFHVFYNNYITSFLSSIRSLNEHHINVLKNHINPHTDLPSFVQTISQLINDIRSYQIDNEF